MDKYLEEWNEVIKKKNLLQDLGGNEKVNLLASEIYEQICKLYSVVREETTLEAV